MQLLKTEEVRHLLLRVAQQQRALAKALEEQTDMIVLLEMHLHRRKAIRRSDPVSTPMTPEVAAAIRAYYELNPEATHRQIGEVFNVADGRVSETLAGKR